MSLVDQFLEDNDALDQYTQDNQVQSQSSSQQMHSQQPDKKQSLYELKKKYNFYNDSDDSSDEDSDDDHFYNKQKQQNESQERRENDDDQEDEDKEESNHSDDQNHQSQQKYDKDEEEEESKKQSVTSIGLKKEESKKRAKYSFSSSSSDQSEDNDYHQEQQTTKTYQTSKFKYQDDSEDEEGDEKVVRVSIDMKKKINNFTKEESEEEEDEGDYHKSQQDNQDDSYQNESNEKNKQESYKYSYYYKHEDQEEKVTPRVSKVQEETTQYVTRGGNQDNSQSLKQMLNQSPIEEEQEGDNESELDFYQLSEVDTSNLLSASIQKPKRSDASSYNTQEDAKKQTSVSKNILRSSITQVASLLDSQIQNYDKLLASSYNTEKQPLSHRDHTRQLSTSEKPQTEMTFGDLTSSEATFYDNKLLTQSKGQESYKPTQSQSSSLGMSQINNNQSKKPTIYQSIIKEEDEKEEESSVSLDYSQHSFLQSTSNIASFKHSQNQKLTAFNNDNSNKNNNNNNKNSSKVSQYFNAQGSENTIGIYEQNLKGGQVSSSNRALVLRILMEKVHKQRQIYSMNKWKEHTLKDFYNVKLKNAAQMVDKMSKFSRSFISMNSLNQILLKNKQRHQAKALIKWAKYTVGMRMIDAQSNSQATLKQAATAASNNDSRKDEIIEQLQAKLEQKEEEIQRMEQMFKEYSNWRTKLEQIEQKMKSDVEYWKQACDKLQKENEKLQKEALKVTQQLMERTKECESKQHTIENLKQKNKTLETVEEAVCVNCKNSLEESTIFTGRTHHNNNSGKKRESDEFFSNKDSSNDLQQQQNLELLQQYQLLIKELNDKVTQVEKEVMIYRERVNYHESVEEELKRNIESQVDVVLKMEEERLLLIKENKEMKEKCKQYIYENDEYRGKIAIFEKELEELQDQIRVQMQKEQEKTNSNSKEPMDDAQSSDTDSTHNSVLSKASSQVAMISTNKENKSQNTKKKLTTSTNKTSSKFTSSIKKPGSQLKFQTSSGSKVGENSAIFSSQSMLKQQLSSIQEDKSSKYGVEPINKSLVTDNQILTNELVMMNREVSKLKAELRIAQDTMKKSEKEKYEMKKSLESKENAVEKLRKEKDELWAIVNTDKYRNIKGIENEKEKVEKQKQELETQISLLKEEISAIEQKQQQQLLRIQELEYSNQRLKEKDDSREKLIEVIEEKNRKYEKEVISAEREALEAKKELESLRGENSKMRKDIDWLANSAKNNKLQAERAINDLEAYTKILRGMEKKLAESDVEKENKDSEIRELKQKLTLLVASGPSSMAGGHPSMIVGTALNNNQAPQQWQQNNMIAAQMHQQQQFMLNQQQQQWMMQQQQQQHQQQQQQIGAPRMGIPQPQQPPQRFA